MNFWQRIVKKHWKDIALGETVDIVDFSDAWRTARSGSHAYAWPASTYGVSSRFLLVKQRWTRTG